MEKTDKGSMSHPRGARQTLEEAEVKGGGGGQD